MVIVIGTVFTTGAANRERFRTRNERMTVAFATITLVLIRKTKERLTVWERLIACVMSDRDRADYVQSTAEVLRSDLA